jgi:hypothetical protein
VYTYNEDFFNDVYSTLVHFARASESDRVGFLYHHTKMPKPARDFDCPVEEWRFCGSLGFGGKYWRQKNQVNCYSEDEDNTAKKIIAETNEALAEVALKHWLKFERW